MYKRQQSKLKVEAARAAGLDTTTVFRKQHEKRRTELVESYPVSYTHLDVYKRQDDIFTSTNERLNNFIFASDLLRKVKDVEVQGMEG